MENGKFCKRGSRVGYRRRCPQVGPRYATANANVASTHVSGHAVVGIVTAPADRARREPPHRLASDRARQTHHLSIENPRNRTSSSKRRYSRNMATRRLLRRRPVRPTGRGIAANDTRGAK